MQLNITFKAPVLPRHYHFLFSSVIKSAIGSSAPRIKEELYYYGDKKNKATKPFCGSIFLSSYELKENFFYNNGDVILTVSSPDTELILFLYNGFIQKQHYTYKDFKLDVKRVGIEEKRLPKYNKALYKTISPIAVRRKDGYFLSIEDDDYEKELNYICNQIIKEYTGRNLKRSIAFQPVLMEKQIVQFKHNSFKRLNDQSILYVQAHKGTFILEGHNEDLKLLTVLGMGNRRNTFLGNIKLIDE